VQEYRGGDAENGPKHSCCRNNNHVGINSQLAITLQKLVPEYIIMVCIE